MATQNPVNYSFTAAADLSAKQFLGVKITAARTVNVAGANDAHGVLQNKPASGEFAAVCMGGLGKAVAGATVAAGDFLTTEATTSRVIAMSGTTLQNCIGIAVDAAVDGDIFNYLAMPPVKTRVATS